MSAIHHIDDIPGYPAPHSPYSHAVVANGLRLGFDLTCRGEKSERCGSDKEAF